MDGLTPLAELAQKVKAQFPAHFASQQKALARVAELSAKYSR
jgi:hypothetical protein